MAMSTPLYLLITGDRITSGDVLGREKPFRKFILVKYLQLKRSCEEFFGMNMTYVFGGALINTSVTPVSESTPSDPIVEPSIAAFMSMMNKAYACGMESQFRQVLEISLDEMNTLIDDRRLSQEDDGVCVMDALAAAIKKEK
jgi:hypothetical protein